MRRLLASFLILVALVTAAACGANSTASNAGAGTTTAGPRGPSGSTPGSTPGTTVAVQKEVLATDLDPPGAPGRTLTLIRYTIAPGAKLAPHIHPGVQLASIQSGSLTYTIISGTGTVTRANGAVEAVTGPSTISLGPGDSVSEKGDMVHFGANETASPIVILASLLTESGRDLAVTVTTTSAPR